MEEDSEEETSGSFLDKFSFKKENIPYITGAAAAVVFLGVLSYKVKQKYFDKKDEVKDADKLVAEKKVEKKALDIAGYANRSYAWVKNNWSQLLFCIAIVSIVFISANVFFSRNNRMLDLFYAEALNKKLFDCDASQQTTTEARRKHMQSELSQVAVKNGNLNVAEILGLTSGYKFNWKEPANLINVWTRRNKANLIKRFIEEIATNTK